MATVFISHSSRDDGLANELESWLVANGFTDLFVDHSSIIGGAKWADALRASAGACRVVICLVTANWLQSSQCPAEFRAAWYMGKRIIPLFVLGDESALGAAAADELRRVRAEDQGIDIAPLMTKDGRLDFSHDEERCSRLIRGLRAAGALSAVGLDPEAFEVDRTTRLMPFPGLSAFGDDDADAALFYGRSREISETLEELRSMRAASDRRPLVIIGASGSGKSSLLKAGIIPRLRRESPAWIPLRAFRPGADPLLNFAESITRTLAEYGVMQAHGALRRSLIETWQAAERNAEGRLNERGISLLVAEIEALGRRLREAADHSESTILISVDQAEELARTDDESSEALGDYLRAAMIAPSQWRLAFTIRTDSFPELQRHRRFQGLEARGYDLRSLPLFRFNDVVEAPAHRYGVEVEPALVDALMDDAPKTDALPLLAFAMQRLWDQFAVQRRLRAEDYRAMGGLTGLIEDAAERAICGLEPDQRDTSLPKGGARKAQVLLAERTFVPPLADLSDDGTEIRRIAEWTEFDEEAQALLERFARWRLVVRKSSESGRDSVEVAHESLFRAWTRLRQWLEPERARLESLRGVAVAAAAWVRKSKRREFLTHFGQRLSDASELQRLPRYRIRLEENGAAYLAACTRAEIKSMNRRRSLQALASVSLLGVIGIGAAYINREALEPIWIKYTHYWGKANSADALATLKPRETFQDCAEGSADCPVMVVVAEGSFSMGSPQSEAGHSDDEEPLRTLVIPRFAVSQTEVSFSAWEKCVIGGRCRALQRPSGASVEIGPMPVTNISWEDAASYAGWLSDMTGVNYRLLSEAEWEYAARAGAATAYSFGDTDENLHRFAWFAENSGADAHPVGRKEPNAFGLFDMNGNVWEWVEDCYGTYSRGLNTEELMHNCRGKVLRGGSWDDPSGVLRSAQRYWAPANFTDTTIGFRIGRDL